MTEINKLQVCAVCGGTLPGDAPKGFCPKCLIAVLGNRAADALGPKSLAMRRFGDYELLGQIAEGGMGVVYLAQQVSLNRTVALKMIRSGSLATPSEMQRFKREAEAAATLDHPNIVPIYEIGEIDGQPFFSMKLIEGGSLAERIERARRSRATKKPISVSSAARLLATTARAVHHAHQRGLLHRDLKPTNILLDDAGEPHLTDFGLAKRMDGPAVTQTVAVIGTPAYMSPEQAAGDTRHLTTAADIYGLGAILYELLGGRPPFEGNSAVEILSRVRDEEPQPLRKLKPGVSLDLETICLTCLQKIPDRRYSTAQSLAEDLERFLRGEPIQARSVGPGEKFIRWCRRKPALAGLLGALAFALILGFAGVTWQWLRADSHAKSETRQRLRAEEAVLRLTFDKAETLFEQNRAAQALAHLARLLRQYPDNRVVASRIQSALTSRGFCLPVAQLRHGARIMTLRFSPDGRRILTASDDNTARMWESSTGRLLFEIKHAACVERASFSPDGRLFLTASRDGTACVWDTRDGRRVSRPMTHEGFVKAAEFCLAGDRVVTGSLDKTARVWDAMTGRPLTGSMVHSDGLESVAFSPDASKVVTVTTQGAVQIWNTRTGLREGGPVTTIKGSRNRIAVFSPDGAEVLVSHMSFFDARTGKLRQRVVEREDVTYNQSAEFSPDLRWLVTSSGDFTARLWDWRTGRVAMAPMRHDNVVTHAGYGAGGRSIVTVSTDNTARTWDTQGRATSEPLRHDGPVWEGQMNSDGTRLVTRLWTSTAWLWEVRTARQEVPKFSHAGLLTSVRFSRDGRRLLTSSADWTARLWDIRSGRPQVEPLAHGHWVRYADFSPDERWIVTASEDGTAKVWDASSGRVTGIVLQHAKKVYRAEFSPDGSRIATSSQDYTAQVWDARTGNPVGRRLQHGSWVFTIHFSPDGSRVVTASLDGTARVWDAATGQPVTPPLPHEESVTNAVFSPDGRRVVSVSRDRTARVWDARTGKPLLPPIEHPDGLQPWSPHLTSDGRRVVTAAGNIARVWDLATGRPLADPFVHLETVRTARFSPDGARVVTTSNDRTARIWDAATGFPIGEPMRHDDRVTCAEFSPDGRWLVTGSDDAHARIWAVPEAVGPIPSWLPELAEAAGGLRLNGQNMLENVPTEERLTLRRRLAALAGTDPWCGWMKQ